jgi:hypothetical protein
LLGITAGSVTVYLKPGWFTKEKWLSVSLLRVGLPVHFIYARGWFAIQEMEQDSLFPTCSFIAGHFWLCHAVLFFRIAITAVMTKSIFTKENYTP